MLPNQHKLYGKVSQRLVKKMLYYKLVHVEMTDIDRYGCCVGSIYRFRQNINQELVKHGAAWGYEEYIKNPTQKQKWLALQNQAKKQKKGLWKNSHPVRPSVYRKRNK